MKQVELVWHRGCPNVSEARARLMRAFTMAGQPVRWQEWCLDEASCPAQLRGYGSPSVFVDGVELEGLAAADGATCRVYADADGVLSGAPSAGRIAAALVSVDQEGPQEKKRVGWRRLASVAPAVGVALLPKIACPACWPAYAGVLSSFGVSFLIDSRYLFALTAGFLAVALFFLGFRARQRRGFWPLGLGLVASAVLLVGKFYFESDPAMFAGVGMLMLASFWNSWPRKLAASPACSACEPVTPAAASTLRPHREVVPSNAACCGTQGETP